MEFSIMRHPGQFSEAISSKNVSEVAFQRAIIEGKESIIDGVVVKWIDIELPVFGKKARGKCVDLIGVDSRGRYVICELKFRRNKSNGDRPEEASAQLFNYYQHIRNFYEQFQLYNLHHSNSNGEIDWQNVASYNTKLIVAANKSYWDFWCGKKHHQKVIFDDSISYYQVNISENEFFEQTTGKTRYMPVMPERGKEWQNVREIYW